VIAIGSRRPPEWLLPTLDGTYQCVGESPGWDWYVRTDLGPSTLRELTAVLYDGACSSIEGTAAR
jgi:hypothetical protein